jgi:hypothetical protein
MNDSTPELHREAVSIAEASAMSGVGRTRLYAEIANGNLQARKFGRRTIVLVNDLKAFLASLPSAA